MKKTIQLFLLCTFLFTGVYAQNDAVNNFVNEGIKLHDKGDYEGAVELYKNALIINPNSPLANYEIASSYLALKNYQNAIAYSNNVIAANSDYVDQAYIIKGTALDLSGKPKEAVKVYKEGIKKHNTNHLLYYNLALTSSKSEEYSEAADALMKGLQINPAHASSHLLLGNIMAVQNHRVKSILALYNFLLLEPKSKRATPAYNLLEAQIKKGVKKENEKSVTITLPGKNDDDEFYTAELMLGLLEASKNNEANKNKTAMELFAQNSNSFFSILGEMKKNNHGFWWDFYVDYFYDLSQNKHTEAFCHYISQLSKPDVYNAWFADNLPKLEAFSTWYSKYERKPVIK